MMKNAYQLFILAPTMWPARRSTTPAANNNNNNDSNNNNNKNYWACRDGARLFGHDE